MLKFWRISPASCGRSSGSVHFFAKRVACQTHAGRLPERNRRSPPRFSRNNKKQKICTATRKPLDTESQWEPRQTSLAVLHETEPEETNTEIAISCIVDVGMLFGAVCRPPVAAVWNVLQLLCSF